MCSRDLVLSERTGVTKGDILFIMYNIYSQGKYGGEYIYRYLDCQDGSTAFQNCGGSVAYALNISTASVTITGARNNATVTPRKNCVCIDYNNDVIRMTAGQSYTLTNVCFVLVDDTTTLGTKIAIMGHASYTSSAAGCKFDSFNVSSMEWLKNAGNESGVGCFADGAVMYSISSGGFKLNAGANTASTLRVNATLYDNIAANELYLTPAISINGSAGSYTQMLTLATVKKVS